MGLISVLAGKPGDLHLNVTEGQVPVESRPGRRWQRQGGGVFGRDYQALAERREGGGEKGTVPFISMIID